MYQFAISPPTATPRPYGITSGTDGNLWLTESAAGKLGRLTPGQFTILEIPIPTPDSDPRGITAGPDGAIWFVEFASAANKVGRRSFAGTFTEYLIPTAASNPLSITTGPDGNLWFTESADAANKIGRLTTGGVFTEFVIPTPNSQPSTITSGPDGNLWFTETKGNKIGRITTNGVIAEYPVPTASSGPLGIVAGPDGNLWFTESLANKIGRLSPPPRGSFYSLTPCRVIDTRHADGPVGGPSLFAGPARSFPIAGFCDVPQSARSVAVNVTITGAERAGYLTLYPGATRLPQVSNINYSAGQTRANSAILNLGTAGDIDVLCGQRMGSVHLILDVTGYFE